MFEKITLGTAQFGLSYGINNSKGKVGELEVVEILRLCRSKGIKHIDTAAAYGDAEELLGRVIERHFSASDFRITSKFEKIQEKSLETLLNDSLTRLRQRSLNAQLFHSYEEYCRHKNISALTQFQEACSPTKLGVSVYSLDELKSVIEDDIAKVVQCPFNLLDNESIRGRVLQNAKNHGIEVFTRSAFLQGLFFKESKSLPKNLKPLQGLLEDIKALCSEYKLSIEAVALGYCLSRKYIDHVVIGVDSLSQLQANLAAVERPLPMNVIERINQIRVENQSLLDPRTW